MVDRPFPLFLILWIPCTPVDVHSLLWPLVLGSLFYVYIFVCCIQFLIMDWALSRGGMLFTLPVDAVLFFRSSIDILCQEKGIVSFIFMVCRTSGFYVISGYVTSLFGFHLFVPLGTLTRCSILLLPPAELCYVWHPCCDVLSTENFLCCDEGFFHWMGGCPPRWFKAFQHVFLLRHEFAPPM